MVTHPRMIEDIYLSKARNRSKTKEESFAKDLIIKRKCIFRRSELNKLLTCWVKRVIEIVNMTWKFRTHNLNFKIDQMGRGDLDFPWPGRHGVTPALKTTDDFLKVTTLASSRVLGDYNRDTQAMVTDANTTVNDQQSKGDIPLLLPIFRNCMDWILLDEETNDKENAFCATSAVIPRLSRLGTNPPFPSWSHEWKNEVYKTAEYISSWPDIDPDADLPALDTELQHQSFEQQYLFSEFIRPIPSVSGLTSHYMQQGSKHQGICWFDIKGRVSELEETRETVTVVVSALFSAG